MLHKALHLVHPSIHLSRANDFLETWKP